VNSPEQGNRIIWGVRVLAAIGLTMVITTTGMVGWTLERMRKEREQASAEAKRLDETLHALREAAAKSGAQLHIILDEKAEWTNHEGAAQAFDKLVQAQINSHPDRALMPALTHLEELVARLVEVNGAAINWRSHYSTVWADLHEQRTMGRVRNLLTQVRGTVEIIDGRQRLENVLKYRRWSNTSGEEAGRQAAQILSEQGKNPSYAVAELKSQLAEFAGLVERLGGEEQFDNLADLKDNEFKPALDRMRRTLAALSASTGSANLLPPQTIETLTVAIFGEGYASDEAHQDLRTGRGGLFSLRRDALQLRREREQLNSKAGALFQDIETVSASFAQSAEVRTAALTEEMERGLAAGWRQMLTLGCVSSLVFLWLAGLIGRGINSQIKAHTHAHKSLEASEQRFRMLSTSAPIGIFETNAAGCILYSNPRWQTITDLSAAESLGDEWRKALHPDDDCVFGDWKHSAAEGRAFEREFRFRAAGGEVRWVHALTTAIKSEDRGIIGHVGTVEDITGRKKAEAELERVHKKLLETSRAAGMAEVATGVLHNVGNVLNSLNVSATLIREALEQSDIINLRKVRCMLQEHATDMEAFLTTDPKGKQLPEYFIKLSAKLEKEQAALLEECLRLARNADHIKEIVAMHQNYARVSGFLEQVSVSELLEDALRMNTAILTRHRIQIMRQYSKVPLLMTDKHKVLQILVNLVHNAKYALDESALEEKQLTVGIGINGENRVQVTIADNGVGIPPENLTRIFSHGFTTRKNGHGFGLHSGANTASELGGSLTVHSDGPGKGAVFTLELPVDKASTQPRARDAGESDPS
jgi:PAS domain S-box-containing protein